MKLSLKVLNIGPYSPHLTNIYICGLTIAPRVRSSSCVVVLTIIETNLITHAIDNIIISLNLVIIIKH